jgi:hypothetical protein
LISTDRLRLDVLLATDRELYSWAGANQFEEGEIDELVTQGAFGTGPFASMLLSVLQGTDAKFTFDGDAALGERRLLVYSFRMPTDRSRYRVRAGKDWVITGYTGSLLVDPVTAELVRLSTRTDELPAETGGCEDRSELEYRLVHLATEEYLLPGMTRQRFIMRDGSEGENTITFSACRDFRGESTVSFSERVPESKSPSASVANVDWRPGLPVTVELTSPPIRADQAAAGDRVEGRLANSINDPLTQTTLARAGAGMVGRLMRVETRWGPPAETTFTLRWETVEVDGKPIPIQLNPRRQTQSAPRVSGGLPRRGIEIELPLPGEERYAVYHVNGEQGVLDRGIRSDWVTARSEK